MFGLDWHLLRRARRIGVSKPHIQRAQPYDHDDGFICWGGPMPAEMPADRGITGVGSTPIDAWRHWCAANWGD